MILAVIGSRNIIDYDALCAAYEKYIAWNYIITSIVSGGASGVDDMAKFLAEDLDVTNQKTG